jgi:6-pyruvoyltetrahydropterin/6-carboxytetrahydropterin synthase
MAYIMIVQDHFDAAHYLRDYQGKCQREHGHRWTIEVGIRGKKLDNLNMLVDFTTVKKELKEVLDKLDHYQLNEVLSEPHPTAEFLAEWIYNQLKWYGLMYVRVWESYPECSVQYDGKE